MPDTKQRIRELNDALRTNRTGGKIVITSGIMALPIEDQIKVIVGVKNFDKFGPDNDPHNEHDFGSFYVGPHLINFKLDYYDVTLRFLSPDPSDPMITRRVMTIMLASEY